MRLLLVEDEEDLAGALRLGLERAGYAVDVAGDAADAYERLAVHAYDLMLLDINLPDTDGFTVCRTIRDAGCLVPILMLTARDAVESRIEGLDAGADDYLVKPFSFDELEARVRALIRRGRVPTAPRVTLSALSLDLVAREARVHGELLDLTAREWAIMELFVTQPGVALSKDRIVQSLSSWDEKLSHNAIEVYVSRLRTKLEPAGVRIRTVRGFGYMLETPRA